MDCPKKPGGSFRSSDLLSPAAGGSYNLSIYIANPDEASLVVWQLFDRIAPRTSQHEVQLPNSPEMKDEAEAEERIQRSRIVLPSDPVNLSSWRRPIRQHQNDTVNSSQLS